MAFGIERGHFQLVDLVNLNRSRHVFQLFIRIHALHGRPIAVFVQQVFGQCNKIVQFGKRAAGHHVHFLIVHRFHAAAGNGNVLQAQFNHRLLQERCFFGVGIQQGNVQIGTADGCGNAGHAAAGTHIHHTGRVFDVRQQGQAVQNVVADHLVFIAQGGEVVGMVPFFKQRHIFQQQQLLCGGQIQMHGLQAEFQLFF